MAEEIKQRVARVFNQAADVLENKSIGPKIRIGLTTLESEHGVKEVVQGAKFASEKYPQIEIIFIGQGEEVGFELRKCSCLADAHQIMDKMLENGELDGAVTLHYSFPLGVSTVGRVKTPARGKEMLIATTTGTSATERVSSMLLNGIYGLATAKALGVENPSLGILNVDGARLVEKYLKELSEGGYQINFVESARADGGVVMRGNDLLLGTPDIMVTDTLTGNMLMKMFSAFNTGGDYEATGYGYGPGVGENYDKTIAIISRASGAPVIANAIKFAAQATQGKLQQMVKAEFKAANSAGFQAILEEIAISKTPDREKEPIQKPASRITSEEIAGIDILEIDNAKNSLWKADIYAETGMGCTGPVILVAEEDKAEAERILKEEGYLS